MTPMIVCEWSLAVLEVVLCISLGAWSLSWASREIVRTVRFLRSGQ